MKKHYLKLISVTSIVTLLAACGGGGDSSNSGTGSTVTPAPVAVGSVTTVAGSATTGNANGTGTAASFSSINGIAVDASGNIYIGDTGNNLIRIITPTGIVSTLAGSGSAGSGDGIGSSASFYGPAGVAVDKVGNVYVADANNNLIRKITPGGAVTTLAGSGAVGSANGTGTAASFNAPLGVSVDGSGNIYVADDGNNLIRMITSAGVVSTLAGNLNRGAADGIGAAASFSVPAGVALDATGNLYVADRVNNLIRKVATGGVVTTLAGSTTHGNTNGTGAAASFNQPNGVTVDAQGNIYVADLGNSLVRQITPAGVVTTLAGSGVQAAVNGIGTAASFSSPTGVAVDASGNVYVADGHSVRKISTQ
ncbi:NHL repeat-containing protein [Collimonas sp. NPDC087041]|uniref:NHL repeat-containing protein n=1 Tax=Collimonas sp. NPDC087041 TaxID=3363960 RepID=UPI003828EE21